MDNLIPIREAARRLNVSDTAVQKAIKTGRIAAPLDEDRNPDNGRPRLRWPDCRDQWNANSNATRRTHQGKRIKGDAGQPSPELGAPKPTIDPPADPVVAAIEAQQPPAPLVTMEPQPHGGALKRIEAQQNRPIALDDNGDPIITNDMTMAEAQRVKAIIAARQAAVDLKKDRGQLVDREKMQRQAFKLARGARDALQTMEDRLAPILASLTDLQDVRQVLRDDIRRVCEKIAVEAASV